MAASINNRPDLKFDFSAGNLIVTDILEEYDDINVSEYICLEYLVLDDKMVNITIRENIHSIDDLEYSTITLDSDGLYTYHRMLIPRIKKYVNSRRFVKNNLFYYNKRFYYILKDFTTSVVNLSDTELFEEVPIKDVFKVVSETLDLDSDHDVLYNSYLIFAYELLKKAFVAEQNRIANRTILDLVNKSDGNRYKRDLYMSTILALREYIKHGDFESANIVLTTLESSACFDNPNKANKITETPCGCIITKDNIKNGIEYLEEITTDDLIPDIIEWTFDSLFPIIFK